MIRRRRQDLREDDQLNITAFMNLMVILVPFLLITAVFSRITILELNPPAAVYPALQPAPEFSLEITVRESAIEVGDPNEGRLRYFPVVEGHYDLAALSEYLAAVKHDFPEKTDATVLLEPEIAYDTLIQVMDTVRLIEVAHSSGIVRAELFPEISLGKASP